MMNNYHSINISTHKYQEITGGRFLKLLEWMLGNVQSGKS